MRQQSKQRDSHKRACHRFVLVEESVRMHAIPIVDARCESERHACYTLFLAVGLVWPYATATRNKPRARKKQACNMSARARSTVGSHASAATRNCASVG